MRTDKRKKTREVCLWDGGVAMLPGFNALGRGGTYWRDVMDDADQEIVSCRRVKPRQIHLKARYAVH
jgi:hypothetical protein